MIFKTTVYLKVFNKKNCLLFGDDKHQHSYCNILHKDYQTRKDDKNTSKLFLNFTCCSQRPKYLIQNKVCSSHYGLFQNKDEENVPIYSFTYSCDVFAVCNGTIRHYSRYRLLTFDYDNGRMRNEAYQQKVSVFISLWAR